jgi:hypothetical protein
MGWFEASVYDSVSRSEYLMRQELDAQRVKAEGYAQLKLRCRALNSDIHDGDVRAMQTAVDLLRAHVGANHVIYPNREIGSWNWGTKTAKTGPILDLESFLDAAHEMGHGMAPKCSGKAPHFQERTASLGCLECEAIAWEKVEDLFPFDDRGFHFMRDSLRAYRQQAAGTPEGIRHVDIVMSYERYDAVQRGRRALQQAQARHARVTRDYLAELEREYQAQQLRLRGR